MGVGRLFEVLHLGLPVLRLAQIAERDGRDGEGRGDQGDPDEAVRLAAARRTVHVSIGVGVFGRLAVAQAAHRRIGSHLGRSRNAGFVVGPAGGLRLSVGRRGRTGKSGCAGCGLRTAGFESEGDGAVGTGPHHAETVEPEFGAVLHGVAHLEDEAVDLPRRFQFAQPPVDKQTAERPVVALQKFRENDAYARLLDDKRPKLGNDEPFVRLKILRYGANQHD